MGPAIFTMRVLAVSTHEARGMDVQRHPRADVEGEEASLAKVQNNPHATIAWHGDWDPNYPIILRWYKHKEMCVMANHTANKLQLRCCCGVGADGKCAAAECASHNSALFFKFDMFPPQDQPAESWALGMAGVIHDTTSVNCWQADQLKNLVLGNCTQGQANQVFRFDHATDQIGAVTGLMVPSSGAAMGANSSQDMKYVCLHVQSGDAWETDVYQEGTDIIVDSCKPGNIRQKFQAVSEYSNNTGASAGGNSSAALRQFYKPTVSRPADSLPSQGSIKQAHQQPNVKAQKEPLANPTESAEDAAKELAAVAKELKERSAQRIIPDGAFPTNPPQDAVIPKASEAVSTTSPPKVPRDTVRSIMRKEDEARRGQDGRQSMKIDSRGSADTSSGSILKPHLSDIIPEN